MTILFRILLIVASLLMFVYMIDRIRKAKVTIEYSLFWIFFAVLLIIISLCPQIAEFIADILGIYSTVNFVYLVIIFILIINAFIQTIKISQLESKILELVQEIAVREASNEVKDD